MAFWAIDLSVSSTHSQILCRTGIPLALIDLQSKLADYFAFRQPCNRRLAQSGSFELAHQGTDVLRTLVDLTG